MARSLNNLAWTSATRMTAFAVVMVSCFAAAISYADSPTWLGFRGEGGSMSDSAPEQVDASEGGNIAWRVSMPGRSVAGVAVAQGTVFTTASSGPEGETLWLTGVDLASGEISFEHQLQATGRPFHHPTGAGSAPNPATDGDAFVAFFSSNDLVCLEADGRLRWLRSLGLDHPKTGNDLGMSSSPIIIDGKAIVLAQSQGNAFVHAVDMQTGADAWQIERPRKANWSSPLSIQSTPPMVVVQGGDGVNAIDATNGEALWSIDFPDSTIPSPTTDGEVLLLPGASLMALDLRQYKPEVGKVPEELYENRKLTTSNVSVPIANGRVYSLKNSILSVADRLTGKLAWKQRLPGLDRTWATPLVVDDRVYLCGSGGQIVVVQDNGEAGEIVSQTELSADILGSPAAVDGRLLIRTVDELICFE